MTYRFFATANAGTIPVTPVETAGFDAWLSGHATSRDPLFFSVIDLRQQRAVGEPEPDQLNRQRQAARAIAGRDRHCG